METSADGLKTIGDKVISTTITIATVYSNTGKDHICGFDCGVPIGYPMCTLKAKHAKYCQTVPLPTVAQDIAVLQLTSRLAQPLGCRAVLNILILEWPVCKGDPHDRTVRKRVIG